MTVKVITGATLALATLLASPVFAQTATPRDVYQAHAQSNFTLHLGHPAHPSWDVYNTNGRYVGSDPDPNVREMIARDRVEQ